MIRYRFLIFFITLIIISCENDINEIAKVHTLMDVKAETGRGVEIYFTEGEHSKIKLIAAKLLKYDIENPYTEMPEGLLLYFYDEEQNLENKLSANYGIHYEKEEKMIARDEVVAITKKGEKIETEELVWDQKAKKIYSNKFVTITTPDEIIMGEGFESDENFENYTIKKIKGEISVEAGEL